MTGTDLTGCVLAGASCRLRASNKSLEPTPAAFGLRGGLAQPLAHTCRRASPEQVERQVRTNLFGPMNVTRAVLPVMRRQRSGHVVTLSSMAGLVGQAFCSAYAASKFGVEGWMESIRFEIEPFGIRTTIVEPGFFRTDLLEAASTTWAELSIGDYAERTAQTRPAWQAMSGRQSNDPAKLARALVKLVDSGQPPLRWVAGADALPTAEQKARDLLGQIEAHRQLSASLTYDDALPAKA